MTPAKLATSTTWESRNHHRLHRAVVVSPVGTRTATLVRVEGFRAEYEVKVDGVFVGYVSGLREAKMHACRCVLKSDPKITVTVHPTPKAK